MYNMLFYERLPSWHVSVKAICTYLSMCKGIVPYVLVLLVLLCKGQFVWFADLYYMLKIAPKLVQEMVNLMQQAWIMYQYQRPKGVCREWPMIGSCTQYTN